MYIRKIVPRRIGALSVAVAATALLGATGAPAARAATGIYVSITGARQGVFPGTSMSQAYTGALEAATFSQDPITPNAAVSAGSPTTAQAYVFALKMCPAVTRLLSAMATQERLAVNIQFAQTAGNGSPHTSFAIGLQNALVQEVRAAFPDATHPGEGTVLVEIDALPGDITMTQYPLNPDGSYGTPVTSAGTGATNAPAPATPTAVSLRPQAAVTALKLPAGVRLSKIALPARPGTVSGVAVASSAPPPSSGPHSVQQDPPLRQIVTALVGTPGGDVTTKPHPGGLTSPTDLTLTLDWSAARSSGNLMPTAAVQTSAVWQKVVDIYTPPIHTVFAQQTLLPSVTFTVLTGSPEADVLHMSPAIGFTLRNAHVASQQQQMSGVHPTETITLTGSPLQSSDLTFNLTAF